MSIQKTEISRREFLLQSSTVGLAAYGLAMPGTSRAARPDKKIKIGQIGTGHAHARGKIKTLRKLSSEFEVVGVAEPNEQLRKAAQRNPAYEGVKWMTVEQLLNTKGLAAVAVETQKKDLVPTGMQCVRARMHIHMDKPAGESLSAFTVLLQEAGRRKLNVQLGYMFRNNPAFKFCFEAVRKGWLGDVFEVHGVISKTINAARRKTWAEYAGGTMFNLGCHLIDALVIVLGKPENVIAYVRRTRPQQDNLADNQLAVFEYPKATATVRSSVMEVDGGKRRQFVVCGDKGTVDIKPLEPPRLLLALNESRGQYKKRYQEVELAAMPGRYDEQLIEFAGTVRGEQEPKYTAEHDLAVHEAVLLASSLPLA